VRHNQQQRKRASAAGFTMLEMTVVIAIILILAGMAIISINGTLPNQQATAGLNAAAAVFRQGRDLAVADRRNYQLLYTVPNQLQLERLGIGTEVATTALTAVTLPGNAQFMLHPGIPDTPDGFGSCSNGLCFGGTPTQTWLSDGTFVDSAGNPLNATIFVAIPGNPSTQKAFTVLGTTGRIRAYRWTGGQWVRQ
jgi:prepilin-type N-terminal cleavage/methylation domain-containing protein